MQDRQPVLEKAPKSLHHLVGEGYLGDKVDHAPAAGDRILRRLQEDVCLARAGDAEEVEGPRPVPDCADGKGCCSASAYPAARPPAGARRSPLRVDRRGSSRECLPEGAHVHPRHPARQVQTRASNSGRVSMTRFTCFTSTPAGGSSRSATTRPVSVRDPKGASRGSPLPRGSPQARRR